MERTGVMTVTLLCMFCMATIGFCGCLDSEEAAVMNMKEIMDSYNNTVNNETKTITVWLGPLDEGDVVIIRDVVQSVEYQEGDNDSRTLIHFKSYQQQGLAFEGDVRSKVSEGDTVEVKLEIVNVTFTFHGHPSGEDYTMHYETYKQGWSYEYEKQKPLPPSTMKIV